ncbi:lasso peptide biosynthesis B2 protein [Streptomyces sp. CSDS2]|uniref:lasso peptide biosynthesis B2 protein n=1 Tax=Streptomyces sp. CSDS2 TaxID=3055051 RepID=UPI0025B1008D|nr:lasso peptide biosynthesis B2 protein [Streptomyces sp. CSDS2]MDN3259515.1 lasso peptide biosynthesis B2 protein [Streptomyces sp. CSDS2]
MSVGMTVPTARPSGPARTVTVRAAVVGGLLLARLPPRRLRAALERLATGARPVPYRQAEEYYREVVGASARCAGWQGCLPRSLAVALLCRLRGRWPQWCVGVRATPPFSAHAWLEADGRIVAEPGGRDDYRVLMRVRAGHG